MARIALIQGGVVRNVVEAASGFTVPGYTTRELTTEHCGPGWTFDGTTFSPPPPPAPLTDVEELEARTVALALVTLDAINEIRQWLAALKTASASNATLANLRTAIAALPNTPDRTRRQLLDAVKGKISDGSVNQ